MGNNRRSPYNRFRLIGQFRNQYTHHARMMLFLNWPLGLFVTPHQLIPLVRPILMITAVLTFIARPLAAFACPTPFGYSPRESAFASWVGLRGAVPIYLTIIPVLAGSPTATLFVRRDVWSGNCLTCPARLGDRACRSNSWISQIASGGVCLMEPPSREKGSRPVYNRI